MKVSSESKENYKTKKVALLASGGVDSSVAMALLKEQGYEVEAFYLKIWLEDELAFLGECPWTIDLEYLEKVCQQLDVKLNILPMQKEYFEKVVSYTIEEVRNGRTPNPDVMCNNHIKFGMFLEKVPAGFDFIASGHYAQTQEIDGIHYLKMAPDNLKDQTYFLANLNKQILAKILFPIGKHTKAEVRNLAEKYNLANKERKDSQGICFLGKLKFNQFIEHYLGKNQGQIIDYDTHEVLGTHNGFYYHTVGQRKGLGLSGGPFYVVSKDIHKNIVYVSKNYFEDNKERKTFKVENLNLFGKKLNQVKNLRVKIRHGETIYNCKFQDNIVTLDQTDQGIASGQFAVFYEEDICLGCGKITNSIKT